MSRLASRLLFRFGTLAAVAAAVIAGPRLSEAAIDASTALSPSNIEIVVVEASGCIYCQLFRRDVAPRYAITERARTVPLRYSDVNDLDETRWRLNRPIDGVPTVLVLRDAREIGRLDGYTGPRGFFQMLSHVLGALE